MTRDEAIAKVGGNRVRAEEIVGALTSLRLLKLEEPRAEWHGSVVEAVRKHPGLHYVAPISVVQALEAAGLRVVPA